MPFEKVSVIVIRSVSGETKVFPVAENIHVNNILHESIVPARITETFSKAIAYAACDEELGNTSGRDVCYS